ncbi:MAG: hypothetical protein GXO50_04260 [Chlorobi bacterium]|nr:hypothetical protein [Chlorobiota bacterium]
MIFKKYIITVAFLLFSYFSFAQNHLDALRYGRQFYSGTAKSDAMANSLSALGADMSSLVVNPAGIAVFKKDVFAFTPNFIINNTESVFLNNERKESKYGFNFSNIGYVWVVQKDGLFKNLNFGITYNSFNDYRSRVVASGDNPNGSILDYFVYNSNSDRYSVFREDLAWRAWLINYDETAGEYWSYVTDDGTYGENQRYEEETKGGGGEFTFSAGGNIGNKLYIGMSLGLTTVNYTEESVYSEYNFPVIYAEDADNPGDSIQVNPNRLDYRQYLYSEGTGINGKFGFIYQPFEFLRIGAAVHTSTGYDFDDEYMTSMYVDYPVADSNGYYDYEPDTSNVFSWSLQTPFRANLGLAFIAGSHKIGKFYTVPATFTLDYEYVDYSRAELKSDYYSFDAENYATYDLMQASHSIRAGAEFNFGFMKIRGGYAVYTSPYKKDTGFFDNAKSIYSGGIGFANEHSFVDISYSYASSSETLNMYGAANVFPYDPMGDKTEPTADVDNAKQFIKVTLGVRF